MTDRRKPPTFALPKTPSPLIVVATSGTGGDILPFITIGQGLLERGYRVLMLVPQFHESFVLAAGVPCQTFGTHDEWQVLLNNPDLWDERKGLGVIWSGLAPHLSALRQLLHHLPANESCVVLSHPILIPMAALARSVRPDLRIIACHLVVVSHDVVPRKAKARSGRAVFSC